MPKVGVLSAKTMSKRGEDEAEDLLSIKVERASPLDVPLLMHMVEDGAKAALFNPSLLEFVELLRLWKRATRASRLFHRQIPCFSVAQEVLFRATVDGETVGLLLAKVEASGTVVLDIVTVDRDWRRRHVARTLITTVIQAVPANTVVAAYCAPAAKEMIGLLGRIGFRTSRVARPMPGGQIHPFCLQLVKRR